MEEASGMTFSVAQRTRILSLKSSIASYYNLQMKKIGDAVLQNYFYNDCVITGGCISSLFHNEAVNDIDVYAKTKKSMMTIKDHIIQSGNSIKTANAYNLDDSDISRPLITENAVTLTNDVQFIYLGTVDECRPKFDFMHCMPWFDIQSQRLHISESQYTAIESKTLVLNISGEAVKDRRIQKYLSKGWTLKEAPVPGIVIQEVKSLMRGVGVL